MPVYNVAIDWWRDGFGVGTGEDVTARTIGAGITAERGRDQLRALAPPMAGQGRFALDNRSRDYSTSNTASPLAGLLYPGCLVRGEATHLGTTYPLWTGVLDDLPQRPGLGERRVDIPWLGTLSRLRGLTLSTPLYTSIRTDQAIGYLLDAAGWPAADRVLSAGRTTLAYWWMERHDAFEMLLTLFRTEGPGAALYEDGRGRVVFEDRYYRLFAARSTTAQATFRDSGAAPWHAAPFGYEPGLKDVINEAAIEVVRRTTEALAVIWQASGSFSVGAGQALAFDVAATAGDPFTGALVPVAGTDYTLTGGSLASVTLSRTSGVSARLTLTGGSAGASLTGLRVRAQRLAGTRLRAVNRLDASASRAKYGARAWGEAVWPEIDLNVATDFCDAIVSRYKDPSPTVTITVPGADDGQLTQVLSREISDRIRVVEAQTGLDAEMHIERIAHAIDQPGRHVATFGCAPVAAQLAYFILDSAASGLLDTNVLAY